MSRGRDVITIASSLTPDGYDITAFLLQIPPPVTQGCHLPPGNVSHICTKDSTWCCPYLVFFILSPLTDGTKVTRVGILWRARRSRQAVRMAERIAS